MHNIILLSINIIRAIVPINKNERLVLTQHINMYYV